MDIKKIDRDFFLKNICNYVANQEWKFLGEKPCVIDFYDEACFPCKAVEPVIKSLSEIYAGRVDFFKVEANAEEDLSRELGIGFLPTLVLCAIDEKPIVLTGNITREKLTEKIEKDLIVN